MPDDGNIWTISGRLILGLMHSGRVKLFTVDDSWHGSLIASIDMFDRQPSILHRSMDVVEHDGCMYMAMTSGRHDYMVLCRLSVQ